MPSLSFDCVCSLFIVFSILLNNMIEMEIIIIYEFQNLAYYKLVYRVLANKGMIITEIAWNSLYLTYNLSESETEFSWPIWLIQVIREKLTSNL